MLRLGRGVVRAVAVGSAIGIAINTLPWLEWRRSGTAMPAGTEVRWLGFALALGLALWLLHWLRRLQRARDEEELANVESGHAFEARAGLSWLTCLLLIAVVAAAGVWLAARKGEWSLVWMGLGVLALLLLVGAPVVRQVARPGPLLRMDRHGIDHAAYGSIPWTEVVGMHHQVVRVRYSTHHVLVLGVRGAAGYMRKASALTRWLSAGQSRSTYGVGALRIPLGPLAKDPELVHRAARSLRAQVDAPFLEEWDPAMDAKEVGALLRMRRLLEESELIVDELKASSDEDDPARLGELTARLESHQARMAAALPEMRGAVELAKQRRTRESRAAWILLAVMAVLLVIRFLG